MREKEKLIEYIKNDIYCRLKPSKIHGVGVFAIKDIPKNTKLFLNFKDNVKYKISKKDLENLDDSVKDYLDDHMMSSPKYYLVVNNKDTFDHLKLYVNHSENPNTIRDNEEYFTKKNIKNGEELLVTYRGDGKNAGKL